jgi:CheY-like chemotaxis protein
MPVMDGVEATRYIRKLPGGDKVKILAVTASVFKEQQEQLLSAGMDGFVCKPYRFNEIYESLSKQLGLSFIYKETAVDKLTPTLDAKSLSNLPAEVRKGLRNALESLDTNAIDAALGKVADQNSTLAQTLSKIAGNLDYPAILNALDDLESSGDDEV